MILNDQKISRMAKKRTGKYQDQKQRITLPKV